jgi:hypothetical protein
MNEFDEWFYGIEGFGCRAERLFADLEYDGQKYDLVIEWLKAAYLVGREDREDEK